MATILKGKRVIIFGREYIGDVPDSLTKHLPKGLVVKPVASSTSTKSKNNDNK